MSNSHIYYLSSTMSSSLWGKSLPCIDSTSGINLDGTMDDILFSWWHWFHRCSPSVNTALSNDMYWLMNLYQQYLYLIVIRIMFTSVALRALRGTVIFCHVSMRLLPWIWIGRWIIRDWLEGMGAWYFCQVSIRLCAIIWIGLWIYPISSRFSHYHTSIYQHTCLTNCSRWSGCRCHVSIRLFPSIWIGWWSI